MAISSHFVAIMGGHLTLTSQVGKGSTFTFTIPLLVVQEEDVATVAVVYDGG